MRLVVAINDRCTISYCARRPIVRSIVATDRAINRDGQRPMVRSIVASCDRPYEQSWHPVTERRSIVAPDGRSYDQSWGATIDRTMLRLILRSIVAIDRCDLRPIVGQSWQSWHQTTEHRTTDRTINRASTDPTESQVTSFEHDIRPCCD